MLTAIQNIHPDTVRFAAMAIALALMIAIVLALLAQDTRARR